MDIYSEDGERNPVKAGQELQIVINGLLYSCREVSKTAMQINTIDGRRIVGDNVTVYSDYQDSTGKVVKLAGMIQIGKPLFINAPAEKVAANNQPAYIRLGVVESAQLQRKNRTSNHRR